MEVTGRKILFVEDDKELAEKLNMYFSTENSVTVARTKAEARRLITRSEFDVIVLDVILPDGSGLDLLALDMLLPPVIILSDLGTEDDILDGLGGGAVDYIVKPCSMRVLDTKMALRLLPDESAKIEVNGLCVNYATRRATYRGKLINLTSSEFNILCFLMANRGEYFTSDDIYREVWNAEPLGTVTIRKHISSMRRKILEITKIEFILTNFGKGYCFIGSGSHD